MAQDDGAQSAAADTRGRRSRGRPRAQDVDGRILEAAVAELADSGFAAFSPLAVAARAGVAKGTVYLRWPTREALALDAVASVSAGIEDPDTGALRTDLLALADQFDAVFARPGLKLLLRFALEAESHPELYRRYQDEVAAQRNAVVDHAVDRARRRGELREDVEPHMVTSALVGALFFHTAVGTPPARLTPRQRTLLGDQLLRGIRNADNPIDANAGIGR